MSEQHDPQPHTLDYRVGANPLNAFQRASIFALRVLGFLLVVYACTGVVGLVGGAAVGMDVSPLGRHLFAIGEYALLGVLAVVFAQPVGRWLGAAA